MILFDENILLNALATLPFKVQGIGKFKQIDNRDVVTLKRNNEYVPIGLDNNNNSGYLRYEGETTFTANGYLDCSTQMYLATASVVLVTGTKGYNPDKLQESIMYKLSGVKNLTLRRINDDKDQIVREERMEDNDMDLLKFFFEYQFDYIKPCADVELTCDC